MTKRLFPASRGKVQEDKRKWNLPSAGKRPSSDERNPYVRTNLHTGCLKRSQKTGNTNRLLSTHLRCLAQFGLEINNVVFPIFSKFLGHPVFITNKTNTFSFSTKSRPLSNSRPRATFKSQIPTPRQFFSANPRGFPGGMYPGGIDRDIMAALN